MKIKTNNELSALSPFAREKIRIAIVRLNDALKYGDDMKSSSYLCLDDAYHDVLSALNSMEE